MNHSAPQLAETTANPLRILVVVTKLRSWRVNPGR